jgi:O-antigen/teichoic acid export membrane protein
MTGRREVEPPDRSAPARHGHLVLRNTTWLVAAQLLATPVSLLVNVMMGRFLGPSDFGTIYLAVTLTSFGFLAVDWGQSTVLPSLVARSRDLAGELLGSALAWRLATAVAVSAVLIPGCLWAGSAPELLAATSLVLLASGLGALARGIQDAIRGLERTDITAYGMVGQPLLTGLLVLPTLLLGGRLRATLGAQAAAAGLGLVAVALALRPVGISRLSVRRATLRRLAGEGSPFLLLGIVLALQTNVDAVMLSRLAPAEALGWQAAAVKLVGMLLFPVTALITSLYPTLSRLFVEDRAAYAQTAGAGLRASLFFAVPVALGCALYPDLGTWLFNRSAFGPAEANLRLLSVYVLLLCLSMSLGCCLSAAGRQRGWAIGQLACVAVSLSLDPLLIPWFQTRTGNGGLGVCTTLVISEVLMLALALALVPRDLLDRALLRALARAVVAGGGMVVVALLASGMPPLVAASLAVLSYAAGLWAVGGVDRAQLLRLRGAFTARAR